jgi:cell wall-associated NlpC family hydrolase
MQQDSHEAQPTSTVTGRPRRWRRLVILGVLPLVMLPLLACGPLASAARHANATPRTPGIGSGPSIPIAFYDLPPVAPCRIAAEFALRTHGLLYSQGGHLAGDPIDPVTGQVCSRTGPRCYDCSGMTYMAYKMAGIEIGLTTIPQLQNGYVVPCTPADLHGPLTTCWATGDLALFLDGTGAYHVAMYIRDGIFAECLNHHDGCRVWERPASSFGSIAVRRIVPDCVRPISPHGGDRPTAHARTTTVIAAASLTGVQP